MPLPGPAVPAWSLPERAARPTGWRFLPDVRRVGRGLVPPSSLGSSDAPGGVQDQIRHGRPLPCVRWSSSHHDGGFPLLGLGFHPRFIPGGYRGRPDRYQASRCNESERLAHDQERGDRARRWPVPALRQGSVEGPFMADGGASCPSEARGRDGSPIKPHHPLHYVPSEDHGRRYHG